MASGGVTTVDDVAAAGRGRTGRLHHRPSVYEGTVDVARGDCRAGNDL